MASRGEQEDWGRIFPGTQTPGDIEAVEAGRYHIEKDQVEFGGAGHLEGVAYVAGQRDRVPFLFQPWRSRPAMERSSSTTRMRMALKS